MPTSDLESAPKFLGHATDNRVAFRVNGGIVQRLVAAANAEEPGRLLKGFLAELRDFRQLLAIRKTTVAVAIVDDILRQLGTDPRDVRQQRDAGHVQVDADMIDARFDHAIKAFAELRLIDVVLVLPDADRLGIGLDQFRQRILQTTSDTDRAADRDVQIGKLLAGQFAGRIDRCTRLADHDLGHGQLVFSDQLTDKRIGFARSGSIADGDQFDVVLLDQFQQRTARRFGIAFRWRRVDRGVGKKLSGSVDHRHFAAGAKARVDADGDARSSRCRHQQFPQVLAKHGDRFFVRFLFQCLQDRRFGCRHQQSLVTIFDRRDQLVVELELTVVDQLRVEVRHNLRIIQLPHQLARHLPLRHAASPTSDERGFCGHGSW